MLTGRFRASWKEFFVGTRVGSVRLFFFDAEIDTGG